MKKSIFLTLFIAVSIGLMAVGADARTGASKSATTILTVKEVRLILPDLGMQGLKLIDEKGHALSFSNNANEWFENAKLELFFIPRGTKVNMTFNLNSGHNSCLLADGAKMLFEVSVNGKIYTIGLGTGSKFVVQKTGAGKYYLLPEETVKLSPPPEGK